MCQAPEWVVSKDTHNHFPLNMHLKVLRVPLSVTSLPLACHSLFGREEVGGSGKLTIKREQLICRRSVAEKRKEGRQPLTQKFPPLHIASQNINWVRNELGVENTMQMRHS